MKFNRLSTLALGIVLMQAAQVHAVDAAYILGTAAGELRSLISANAGPFPLNAAGQPDLSKHKELGVKMIRTQDFYGPLDMPTLYPDFSQDPQLSTSYVFSAPVGNAASDSRDSANCRWSSDTIFSAIVDNGFEPFFRLGDSWNNVKPPATDSERANWAAAAVNILKHYRTGQWGGFQNSFRYVEVGNEPDNVATFWPAPRTMMEFFKLYEATATALRSAFPSGLKIGGPGLTHGACTTTEGKAWVNSFLDYVRSKSLPLDFFSWHMYSSNPEEFATCAAYYRTLLDSKGFSASESINSEWHTDTYGLSEADAVAVRSAGRGAALITASWIKLHENKVDQSLLFRVSDPNPAPADYYGLYDSNQAIKKTGLAFKLWNLLTATFTQRLTTTLSSGNATDLTAMGVTDGNGKYAFIIANIGNSAKTWSLTLPNGSTLAATPLTLYTASDALSSFQISSPGSEITLPAESVQLALIATSSAGIDARASASGSSSNLTLAAQVRPSISYVGESAQAFVVAQVGDSWYFLGNSGWQGWSGGDIPTYFAGTLPAVLNIPLFSNADLRSLGGTKVYVGYGFSATDMLNNSLYRLIYTLPSN